MMAGATRLRERIPAAAGIEQAKGVLIEQSGISAEEAFDALKRASQRENRNLRGIAVEIVRRAQERPR